MNNKLPVIYDISVLGIASVDEKARTGVFRYVENLFIGLKSKRKIKINSFALKQFYNNSLNYVNEIERDKCFIRRKRLLNEIEACDFIKKKKSIFHSPYFAIPDEINDNKGAVKILTVYDLIPVLFPEYFLDAHIAAFKKILSSIRPETKIICISESTKNDLCNYCSFIDQDNVKVTYLGASELFYQVKSEKLINAVKAKYRIPDGPYILSLATLEPRKNTSFIIDAFIQLCQESSIADLNLVLVGTRGWKFDEIFEKINKSPELTKRIIITGYVDDNDLAPLYSGALCFVYPSKYEGFGLPPLEAMQCGTPVITSNNSSLPEVVGDAGIMIDIRSPYYLTEKMHELYKNTDARKIFSTKGLMKSQKFSWAYCIKKTIEVYDSIIL